jgi:hypothetical protein
MDILFGNLKVAESKSEKSVAEKAPIEMMTNVLSIFMICS